jgi:SAM-dependent methyltransferase
MLLMIDRIQKALQRDIATLTFNDNSYVDEAFMARCVSNNFAGWYDQDFVEHQVAFVLHNCATRPGGRVLDAACGHGKHSEALVGRGLRVLGTDVSGAVISHLSERNIDGAEFRCLKFREMDFANEFNLAIALGNSLSLLPRQELPEAVRKLAAAVAVDGRLFIEMDNRPYFISHEAGRKTWTYRADRWIMLSSHYYDSRDNLEKTIDTTVDLMDGSVDQFLLTKCLYDPQELMQCLQEADLQIESTFGDWSGSEITPDSPSILIVSRRAF